MLRVLAIFATLLGIAAGALPAGAQAAPHVMRPICLGDLAIAASDPTLAGDARQMIVTVTRTAGSPCVVANFPQIAPTIRRVRSAAFPSERLSLGQSATVGSGNVATFFLRYTAAAPAAMPSPDPGCDLTVLVNGVAAKGFVHAPEPCAAIAEIAVSSFAQGATPPDDATATPALAKAACRPQDLELRDVGSDPDAGTSRETYAVQNVGLAACRLSGAVGVTLRDANGQSIPVYAAARTTMPMRLTLQRGHEASFTVAYAAGGPNGEQHCVSAQTIAVTIVPYSTAIAAPTHVAPCPPAVGAGMRVSNLRLGIPMPPSARP